MSIIREYEQNNRLDTTPDVPSIVPSIRTDREEPGFVPTADNVPIPEIVMPEVPVVPETPRTLEVPSSEQLVTSQGGDDNVDTILPRVSLPNEHLTTTVGQQDPNFGSTPPSMLRPELDKSPRVPFQEITVDVNVPGWERIRIPQAPMPSDQSSLVDRFLESNGSSQLLQPPNSPTGVYTGNPVLEFITNIFGGKDLYEKYYKKGIGQTGAASGLLYGLTLPWNVVNGVAADLGRIGSGILAGRSAITKEFVDQAAKGSTNVTDFARKILNKYSESYWNQINSTATNGGTYTQQALLGRQFSFADERVNEQKDFTPFGLLPEYGSYTRAPDLKDTESSKRIRDSQWINQATAVLGIPVEAAFQAISGNKDIKLPKFSDWLADRVKQAALDPGNYYRSIAGFALDAIGGSMVDDLPSYVRKGIDSSLRRGVGEVTTRAPIPPSSAIVRLPIGVEPQPVPRVRRRNNVPSTNVQVSPIIPNIEEGIEQIYQNARDIQEIVKRTPTPKYNGYSLDVEFFREMLEKPYGRKLEILDGDIYEVIDFDNKIEVLEPLKWNEYKTTQNIAKNLDRPVRPGSYSDTVLQVLSDELRRFADEPLALPATRRYMVDMLNELKELPPSTKTALLDMQPDQVAAFFKNSPLLPPGRGAQIIREYGESVKMEAPSIQRLIKELYEPDVINNREAYLEIRAEQPRALKGKEDDVVSRTLLQSKINAERTAELALNNYSRLQEMYERLDDTITVSAKPVTDEFVSNVPVQVFTGSRLSQIKPGQKLYKTIDEASEAALSLTDDVENATAPTIYTYEFIEPPRVLPVEQTAQFNKQMEKLKTKSNIVKKAFIDEVARNYDITSDGTIIRPAALVKRKQVERTEATSARRVREAEFNSDPSPDASENLRTQMLDDLERDLEEAGVATDNALDDMIDATEELEDYGLDDYKYGYGYDDAEVSYDMFDDATAVMYEVLDETALLESALEVSTPKSLRKEWQRLAESVYEALIDDDPNLLLDEIIQFRNSHSKMATQTEELYEQAVEVYMEAKRRINMEMPRGLFPSLDEVC